jgi:two-component system, NtrC family, response regulator AtoC
VIGNATKIIRLLVVSRDSVVLRSLWAMGESNYWEIESAANAWEAMERVQSGITPTLLLLDLPHGDADGLHMLRCVRRLRPALPIILLGHPDDVGKKQEALRLGARDYLIKPLGDPQLEMVIRQHLFTASEATETDITSDDIELIGDDTFFIGTSPTMRQLRARAALLADADVPVLILGEGGSGKETTARLVHRLSFRSGYEFAKVNCAALPSDLLERELFGYESDGAAAPARTKSGKLELCAKGTILLDEITEMPMRVQANLMSVLQDKRFVRPGTSDSIRVDVRVLAASTTNMEHAISKNRLRNDLYYHLSAHTVHVPPLRERMEELPLLSHHLMRQLARHYGLSPRDFSPAIVEACQAYSWPGNLRELENFVKRYLLENDKELDRDEVTGNVAFITSRSSNPAVSSLIPHRAATASDSLRSLVQSVKSEAERNAIVAALEKTGGNRKAAAGLLKVSYRTLLYKIVQYQLRSPDNAVFPGNNGFNGTGLAD